MKGYMKSSLIAGCVMALVACCSVSAGLGAICDQDEICELYAADPRPFPFCPSNGARR